MTELEERTRELEAKVASTSPENRLLLALLLSKLGSNLEAIGQRERALNTLQRSLQLFEALGDSRGKMETLNRIATVLIAMRRLDEAKPIVDEVLATARLQGEPSIEATSLNNLAILEEMSGNLDCACELYEHSLELLRALDDTGKLATTLNNVGVTYGKMVGRDDEARAVWREALALYKNVGDDAGVASTLNNAGLFLADRGKPSDAIDYCEKAVAIQERIGDKGELALMLGNLAFVYSKLGRHAEACSLFERKLVLQKEINDEHGGAVTLHLLANTMRDMGLAEDAYVYYSRAVNAFTLLGNKAEVARAELDQAFSVTDSGKAIAHAERALEVQLALGDEREIGAALDGLGILYSDVGNYEKAIALMERSIEFTERSGDQEGLASLFDNLGCVCEQAKLYAKAIDYYERALLLVRQAADREAILSALDALRAAQA